MHPATLYRVLGPDEPRPAGTIRVRVPVDKWHDCQRPKAGYRCRNPACGVAVVLVEIDNTGLPLPRTPQMTTAARRPFCGRLLSLVRYYELVELAPA